MAHFLPPSWITCGECRAWRPRPVRGLLVTARRILVLHNDQMPDQPLAAMTGEYVCALVEHLLSLSSNGYTRTSTTSYARTFLQFPSVVRPQ